MRDLKALALGLVLSLAAITGAFAQCGTTAPANTYCGNNGGSPALAGYKPVSGLVAPITVGTSPILSGTNNGILTNNAGVLGNTAAGVNGQVLIGNTGAQPSWASTVVLGIPGTTQGSLGLAGATSGTATFTPQAAAGTTTLTLPTVSGTLAVNASTPLVLNAVTGALTCPTCATSSGGGAITGTAPISVSAAGVVSINAPYVTLTASLGGIVYSGSTNLAILSGTATARQMLQSGASAAPAWSTTTWPATTTINRLLYSSAANVISDLATANGGILNTSSGGVPSITPTPVLGVAGTTVGSIGFQNATSGTVTLQPVTGALGTVTINIPAAAGTMAVSATAPITLSAAGAIGVTGSALTKTDDTNVTLTLGGTPATSLLAATSLTLGWTGQLGLTRGGTGASLTASNGGLVYSTGSALAILSGTATAGQIPRSGSSAAPSWSTSTYPATSAAGTVLSSLTANTVTASANPVLGIAGSVVGDIGFANATSGSATLRPVTGALGSAVVLIPGASGTMAVSATTPVVLNASTGALTCPTCTTTIASGAKALATSAISSATCTSVQTDTATGAATTDVVTAVFNADPTATTGYVPLTSGMLTIIVYPTSNTVNFKVCNNTLNSITPGAITLNWRVVR